MTLSDKDTNLVWIDMEMTGLNPDSCRVLEIATIITNSDLEIVAIGPEIIIHQSPKVLENMDEWCKVHHQLSGLTQRSTESKTSEKKAELKTLAFIKKHCTYKKAVLCGNSIWKDRHFIIKYFPNLNDFLHFVSIDVSSVRELARRWSPTRDTYSKTEFHRASDDINDSINELRYYRKNLLHL